MQGRMNIEIDGKQYGVLVRPTKYGFTFKLAQSVFSTVTLNQRYELESALSEDAKLKARFFRGETIYL